MISRPPRPLVEVFSKTGAEIRLGDGWAIVVDANGTRLMDGDDHVVMVGTLHDAGYCAAVEAAFAEAERPAGFDEDEGGGRA